MGPTGFDGGLAILPRREAIATHSGRPHTSVAPGEGTGSYVIGKDAVVVYTLSAEDCAVAPVGEIETPAHPAFPLPRRPRPTLGQDSAHD